MQVAGRVPTQARRWGFQVVLRVHKDTPLGNPGRKEGEGKEVGEAIVVILLDVLTVDVVERVGENRAVREGRGESVWKALSVGVDNPVKDTVTLVVKVRVVHSDTVEKGEIVWEGV